MCEYLVQYEREIHAAFIVAIFFAAAIVFFAVQAYFEAREFGKPEAKHKRPKKKYNDDLMEVANAVFTK